MDKKTFTVKVGNVLIGGNNPVVIQSMTDTLTYDIDKTVMQIIDLVKSGSEIVRITVDNEKSAQAVPIIKRKLLELNCNVPLVGDFHYNGHTLLSKYKDCAKALSKYRINPGNVGFGRKKDAQFSQIIEIAILYNKPVRIGVNWGSLDQNLLAKLMDENLTLENPLSNQEVMENALITSALSSAEYAENLGLAKDKIIISCKVSNVRDLISVYTKISQKCNYPLHLGLTEAGMGDKSVVSTSIALGHLLLNGIGDTIRASLTPEPNGLRIREVKVCKEILQALDLRNFAPKIISCPGCGRTSSSFFRELANNIDNFLQEKMPVWKNKYKGVENLKIAVMGCIVNGPGESKHSNIGISLPGVGEKAICPVFIDGIKKHTLRGDNIFEDFKQIVINYIKEKYGY